MCTPGFGLLKTWQGIVEMVLRVTSIVSDTRSDIHDRPDLIEWVADY